MYEFIKKGFLCLLFMFVSLALHAQSTPVSKESPKTPQPEVKETKKTAEEGQDRKAEEGQDRKEEKKPEAREEGSAKSREGTAREHAAEKTEGPDRQKEPPARETVKSVPAAKSQHAKPQRIDNNRRNNARPPAGARPARNPRPATRVVRPGGGR